MIGRDNWEILPWGRNSLCLGKKCLTTLFSNDTFLKDSVKSSIAESSFVVAEIYSTACLNSISLKVKKIEKCASLEEIFQTVIIKSNPIFQFRN